MIIFDRHDQQHQAFRRISEYTQDLIYYVWSTVQIAQFWYQINPAPARNNHKKNPYIQSARVHAQPLHDIIPMMALDGGLEGPDGIEGTFEAVPGGIGEIRVSCIS